ncbi:MAG TPA: hypothetical protein VJ821_01055 [Anaerolineales bacterium]|nr:hypothetical protein [Anaerolineales bacterium]
MKRKTIVLCVIALLISSCSLSRTSTPTPLQETPTPIVTNTSANGNVVTLNNVSLTLPTDLANDVQTEMRSAVTDGAPWEVVPAYLKFTLTGYQLQELFHEPNIFVFPADEFGEVNEGAAEQIDRLNKALAGSPVLQETLPTVPWFNAAPLIAAGIKIIPFQSGSGVRALTQYAQYAAPINNRELFYQFQGLTEDRKTYIIAILPVTAPFLAEDEKPDAPVPADGVPIPTDVGPNDVYYASITENLNSLSPDEFTPALDTLDDLVQSILVTNP